MKRKKQNNSKLFLNFLKDFKKLLIKHKVRSLSPDLNDDNFYVRFNTEHDGIFREFSYHTYGNDNKGLIRFTEFKSKYVEEAFEATTQEQSDNTLKFINFCKELQLLLNRYKVSDLYRHGPEEIYIVFARWDKVYRFIRYKSVPKKKNSALEYREQTQFTEI